jgi:hypothetical protein
MIFLEKIIFASRFIRLALHFAIFDSKCCNNLYSFDYRAKISIDGRTVAYCNDCHTSRIEDAKIIAI